MEKTKLEFFFSFFGSFIRVLFPPPETTLPTAKYETNAKGEKTKTYVAPTRAQSYNRKVLKK